MTRNGKQHSSAAHQTSHATEETQQPWKKLMRVVSKSHGNDLFKAFLPKDLRAGSKMRRKGGNTTGFQNGAAALRTSPAALVDLVWHARADGGSAKSYRVC